MNRDRRDMHVQRPRDTPPEAREDQDLAEPSAPALEAPAPDPAPEPDPDPHELLDGLAARVAVAMQDVFAGLADYRHSLIAMRTAAHRIGNEIAQAAMQIDTAIVKLAALEAQSRKPRD